MTFLSKVLCRPCVFCGILDGSAPARLVYKDNDIAAFHDISPSADTHILIIPVEHIESVKTVTPEHIGLLEKMRQKGMELLQEEGCDSSTSKLGFHVPPFNTIGHLHLHVIGGAYKSRIRKLKYESGRMWYMDMSELLTKLEKLKQSRQEVARL